MRSLRGVLALSSAVCLVLAVAGPAAATRGQPDLAVPFHMQIVAQADEPLNMSPGFPFVGDTFGGRCSAPASWVATINSVGTAGHLGEVTVTQSHCTQINVFSAPPFQAVITDGKMTITAANGDELRVSYSGSFLFYPTGEGVGISRIAYSSMAMIGGTGRFAGASGWMAGSATDNFPGGPNLADFHGAIAYDASDVE